MKEAGIYGVVQKHIVGLCATLLRLKKMRLHDRRCAQTMDISRSCVKER